MSSCSAIAIPQSVIIKTTTSRRERGKERGGEGERWRVGRARKGRTEKEKKKGGIPQWTKWKQIKGTLIKHRCCKENKLHKIYCFARESEDIGGKAIRFFFSQVMPRLRRPKPLFSSSAASFPIFFFFFPLSSPFTVSARLLFSVSQSRGQAGLCENGLLPSRPVPNRKLTGRLY